MIINTSNICAVNLYKSKPSVHWKVYTKKIKNFFGKTISEKLIVADYFYEDNPRLDFVYDISEFSREGYFIKDNVVYYKDHVEVDMADTNTYTILFDSLEDAEEWINTLFDKSIVTTDYYSGRIS